MTIKRHTVRPEALRGPRALMLAACALLLVLGGAGTASVKTRASANGAPASSASRTMRCAAIASSVQPKRPGAKTYPVIGRVGCQSAAGERGLIQRSALPRL